MRKRVKKGNYYYRFDIFGRVHRIQEQGSKIDKYNFFIGNYFRTKKDASKARGIYFNEENIQ